MWQSHILCYNNSSIYDNLQKSILKELLQLTSYCSLTSDLWTAQHQNKARSAWPAMWLIGNGYFRTTHCKLEKCQLTILPGISGMHRSSAAQWWRSGVYTLHGSRKHSWVMLWRPAVLRLTPEECAENELWRYKAEDNLTLDSCEPLLLVIELKLTFRIWLEKHCITATNIPSERLFSSARNLVSNKRSCLLPENVANLMKICSSLVSCVTFHILCTNCLYNPSMWVLYINNNQCILAALMCAVHLRVLRNCVHAHTHTHIHTHPLYIYVHITCISSFPGSCQYCS